VRVPASAAVTLPDTGASNLKGLSQSPTQYIIVPQHYGVNCSTTDQIARNDRPGGCSDNPSNVHKEEYNKTTYTLEDFI